MQIENQNGTTPNQQDTAPTSTTDFKHPQNGTEAPKINIVLLLLLIATLWVALAMGSFIVGDIRAGALHGEAETGYGFVFAMLLSPIFIALFTISLLRIRRAKKNGISVAKTVKFATLITLGLVLISSLYSFAASKYESPADKARKAKAQQTVESNKNEDISITKATELLNACKLRSVNNGTKDTYSIGNEVRNSSTGVVLTKVNGSPYNVWVNDDANKALLPAIKEASKNCPNFQKS